MRKIPIGLIIVVVVYLALALFQLRELPGEWFGDISILHEEVLDILANPFDWKFNLSAGPVYHHVVALLAAVLGANFLTYKIASVLTGLAGLVLTYFWGKEVFGERAALWGTALMGTSFWMLVWARLGIPQILSLVLVAGSLWLAFRWLRTRKAWELAAAEAVAVLGLWTYPAVFVLPILPLIVGIIGRVGRLGRLGRLGLVGAVVVLAVALGLFGLSVKKQPSLFTSGYVGEKVFGYGRDTRNQLPVTSLVTKIISNVVGQVRGFVDRGDASHRTNIAGTPHVDGVTGLLLALGWAVLLLGQRDRTHRTTKTHTGRILAGAFVLLLLPASSPSILPGEIPSSGRTFGVAPLVFIIAGSGIETIRKKLTVYSKQWAVITIVLALVGIGGWNIYRYFWIYPTTLPNQNTAPGWETARWLDTLPPDVTVKLTACCWGQWGEAEPKGILYQMKNQVGRANIIHDYPFVDSCDDLKPGQTYALVFAPNDIETQEKLAVCVEGEWARSAGFAGVYGKVAEGN